MSKKRNNNDDEKEKETIVENISFNENKTIITYTVQADDPISEDDFIYCLSDFVRCFGDGFDFKEVGELVPFEMFDDEYPDDGVMH